jgi:hypothetical protein
MMSVARLLNLMCTPGAQDHCVQPKIIASRVKVGKAACHAQSSVSTFVQ